MPLNVAWTTLFPKCIHTSTPETTQQPSMPLGHTHWTPALLQPDRVAWFLPGRPGTHTQLPRTIPGKTPDQQEVGRAPILLASLESVYVQALCSPQILEAWLPTCPQSVFSLITSVTCCPGKAAIFTNEAKTWRNCLAPTLQLNVVALHGPQVAMCHFEVYFETAKLCKEREVFYSQI